MDGLGAAALGIAGVADAASAPPGGVDGRAVASAALAARVRLDEEARASAADDFGHVVHRRPAAVVAPASAEETAAAVRWAAARRCRTAAQGQRHSTYGRAQARGGIALDMSRLSRVHRIGPDSIVVGAGATWRAVLAAALPLGRTPPVLPDYLDLSVGGTLVVGGIGATTWRHGALSDNVLEMEVVVGTGTRLTCSADRRRELFDAVRAGLGQAGIVTRATIALAPAPQRVRRFLLAYPDLATMLGDARLLAASRRFEAVQGAIVPGPHGWSFRLDAAAYRYPGQADAPDGRDDVLLAGLSDHRPQAAASSLPYLEYLDRLSALERTLRGNGQWSHPHPWLTTFVGDAVADAVVAVELAALDPADLGRYGQVVLSPLRRAAISSPLLRLPAGDLCHAFNLIRMPAQGSATEASRLVVANRAAYERVRDAGGTLYPVSAFPMSAGDWRRHFGSAFDRLRSARRRYDPAGILTPGYDVFRPADGPEDTAS